MQWDVDISKKRRERPLEVERLMRDLLSRSDEDEPMEEDTEVDVNEDGKISPKPGFLLLMGTTSFDSTPVRRPRNKYERCL